MPKIAISAKRGLDLKRWEDIQTEQEIYEGNLLDEIMEKNDKSAGVGGVKLVGGAPEAPEPPRHSIEDVIERQGARRDGNGNSGPKVYRRN